MLSKSIHHSCTTGSIPHSAKNRNRFWRTRVAAPLISPKMEPFLALTLDTVGRDLTLDTVVRDLRVKIDGKQNTNISTTTRTQRICWVIKSRNVIASQVLVTLTKEIIWVAGFLSQTPIY